ncbi:PIN domain-containing protein [Gordonia pseudamarae]|jgi:predicted nucleic acid-binding protein|uniref:Ribonuclease VapC n=1 Tax=Gordonia pseudamarae TaxID=2831662 RepID=A0ABX6ILX8_9ACTN|nr:MULTISPECIES: type II toxin-antitoxin system VapC family toxin [Gordonia]MBD0020580.1 type II toxin-antitoxin system VapC family toxin [Gordonia sp. (in: high G+C Gram-positive bacteria)]QHN27436.1 PIN domain-containing protein [Gordonia pseudamarae]QHN36320.1 PIN domain-containing protein [Gordonia pseudamarae]
MRRVVDASALIDSLLPSDRQDAALAAMSGRELWAPAVIDMEVSSAIWRLERTAQISSGEAERAVAALWTVPLRRAQNGQISRAAWRLRKSLRVSDAFYVATAQLLHAELITADARLSRAPSLVIPIVVLPH